MVPWSLQESLPSPACPPLCLRKGSGGEVGFERDFSGAESSPESRKSYHSLSKLKCWGCVCWEGNGGLSGIMVSPGHGQQIIPLCSPTAQQTGPGTEWISVLICLLVHCGQGGAGGPELWHKNRKCSCADLREDGRVRNEGLAHSYHRADPPEHPEVRFSVP